MSNNWQTTIPGSGGGSPSPTTNNRSGNIWSALSGLIGIGSNAIQNKQTKKREAEKRAYDLEQWQRKNQYNHPLEQMRRLKDAGLNPNLIYGSSPGSAVGNADGIHAGKAPEYKLDNPVTGFMNTRLQQSQTNNLNSLSTLNDVKALTELQNKNLRGTEADLAKGNLQSSMEIRKAEAKTAHQKFLQSELETIAVSENLKPRIAKFAAEAMTAKINQDTAAYLKNVAALKSYLTTKGILPTSYQWAQIIALIPGVTGKIEVDHKGFEQYKQKNNN
jgi:hypothetical protein